MSEKLIIKNFGPIREAILDLRKTTVFIGPQGSGKSTIAKLVAIFKNKPSVGSIPPDNNFGIEVEDYGMELYFSSKEKTQIFYAGKALNVTVEGQNFAFEEFENTINSSTTIFVPTERTLIPIISNAIFSLLNNKVALPDYLTRFSSFYEVARKKSDGLRIDYLDITYIYAGNDEYILKNDVSIQLNKSASGYQALLPLKIVVENFYPKSLHYYIIEEPELNLFPTIQKEVVNYLVNRCTKGENELLITTHSPYILSALNNLLFAYKTAEKHPDRVEEIAERIPKESWLNPAEFNAYYVGEGTVTSIFDEKNGLIADNALDEISIDLAGERDFLMDIYFSEVHEGVN